MQKLNSFSKIFNEKMLNKLTLFLELITLINLLIKVKNYSTLYSIKNLD